MSFESHNLNQSQTAGKCVHPLFEEQVERTPDAVALVCEGRQLTYRELNSRANQLGRRLQRLGVGPEVLVGICLDRSLEMIVGLLGVLKAGGAYVPLDPYYPPDRLSFMLADADVRVLLTRQALREQLSFPVATVITMDSDWEHIAKESDRNVNQQCAPQNLAYVIYTSGSTGRPKGVCVAHASVVNLVDECRQLFSFGSDDVWTVVHSYAFDFSVWEIFAPLLCGSRLVVVPLAVTQSPADLYQLLREQKVTILNQTPLAARQLLEATRNRPIDDLNLRLLICGGESLPSALATELLSWKVPLWNFYGPTESTVWATIKKVESEDLTESSVSIGRAIHGLETQILDQDLQPVSGGAAGELCLGGPGLARGYLNRSELTADRFIPNSFNGEAGARLYRTGDLARYRADGNIEHLGRLDHQVKIRGFRIELEEIEAVLAQHPSVRETVVAARAETGGEKRLVAYVVANAHSNSGESSVNLDEQRLSDWQAIWNETYSQPAPESDPTFNIIGWNSSYTGLPYSVEEMKEWVDHSVERILALRPKRVLEIGCGSGLLLFRVAPQCEQYVGTEPSAPALALLRRQLSLRESELSQATLLQKMADDFEGFEPESFDTVVINSVVQYFPSIEYLARVLTGAVRVTKPGGAIFVGDVRNLTLLKAFHTSLQLTQAADTLAITELSERIRRNIAQDEQLAIDPAFFEQLSLPRINQVEVQLKRGRAQNETTKFRYDVCLRVGATSGAPREQRFDWQTQQLTPAEVSRLWVGREADALMIANVANERLLSESAASDQLQFAQVETVAELRRRLRANGEARGVDPEAWWRLADELNCDVSVTWSASGRPEWYDVSLKTRGLSDDVIAEVSIPVPVAKKRDWRGYANDPLHGVFIRTLVPRLRSFLRERLPEYMMPSTFVLLDALPLTSNVKINRAALPAPDSARPELDRAFSAPRSQVEAKLARIWAGVLKLDRVGIHDNFMELGGHSVLATQIVSRLRDAFRVELPLRSVFESPSVAELAEKIEARQAVAPTPLRPSLRGGRLRLSFAQERLWFLNELVENTPVYNMPSVVRLSCALNVPALRQSLNEIIRRHESLRTTIEIVDGNPYQVIAPDLELALPLIELQDRGQSEQEATVNRLATEEAEELFDLTRGPLLRARLLQLAPQEYVLLVTMHHIISDNWSIIVFFEELSTVYAAFSAGEMSPLAELPIQYPDYAVSQRSEMEGALLDSQLDYWKRQLAGAPTVLELPTDGPRPPNVSFHAARQSLTLDEPLVKALRTLSQREGVTTFMTLLATFNILLSRYTGQDDILVGSPIANRTRTETESLIGLFLNNLVLRTRLSGDPTFGQLLAQVRDVALGAYANQDVPFQKLVAEMKAQRDPSRMPLFQVFFNLFDAADNKVNLSGVTADVFSPVQAWSQFDLTLYAAEDSDTIELIAAYNLDLFAGPRMAALLEQFHFLLEQIVAQPDKPISKYSLLTATASALLPDPATVLSEPELEPITKTFFARAAALPERTAICKGAASWSYGELAAETRSIAHALLRDGLKKGEVVAVSGSTSFGLIAGMLAVFSSGGVLLTLDRNLPAERRKLMVREAGAKRVLHVGDRIPDDDWMRALVITLAPEDRRAAAGFSRSADVEDFQLPDLSPADAAYLFFTSGTSGVPKGVLGSHKGLSHFLSWQREEFGIHPGDRSAQLTALSFDVVLRDIFLPLTSGASLHLPDDAEVSSGDILSWLEREQISILHTVPTLAQAWLDDIPRGVSLPALRLVFFAGEPLTDSTVHRWREAFSPGGKLVNLYGPTETTLAKCFYVVPAEPSFGVQPVGRPLPNTQALVLTTGNRLCGIGEGGEIVIRTPFRTLGYINATEEQQARFITNPFVSEVTQTVSLRNRQEAINDPAQANSLRYDAAADLLYRTGDRGRYRPDGQLEILGRLDDQIKIRGVRVEPAEVTATLERHPDVRQCIVTTGKDAQGENALIAYVVTPENDQRAAELRSYLGKLLPAAMVPSWFVVMKELPLTPNGKVDRKALPEPDRSNLESEQQFVAPRNRTEEIVAGIWAEVLGVEQISVVRDFFELGGQSLLATQIISRVRDALQAELPLSSVFESPTVAGLSQLVEEAQRHRSMSNVPAIKALPRKRRPTLV
jgi:amino acid adenylation domain-containing protein